MRRRAEWTSPSRLTGVVSLFVAMECCCFFKKGEVQMQPATAPAYKSRRADAAAAASASAMTPINKRSTKPSFTNQKRTDRSGKVVPGAARLVRPPHLMAPPPPRDSSGQLAVLQKEGTLDVDEVYGEQEKALSDFIRLHPMLSVRTTISNPLTQNILSQLLRKASYNTSASTCTDPFLVFVCAARIHVAPEPAAHGRPPRRRVDSHQGARGGPQES